MDVCSIYNVKKMTMTSYSMPQKDLGKSVQGQSLSIPNKTTLHIYLVDFVGFQRFPLHKERKQMNMQTCIIFFRIGGAPRPLHQNDAYDHTY